MRDFEGNAGSPLSTKDRIRERYKGINPDELEVIPALPKENIFESTKTRRVAVYARVSTGDPRQTSSYELQKNHYLDVVNRNPSWSLVDIYADEGISGTSLAHRDEFKRMIADCKRNKIDFIVTKSVSRFARNVLDCIGYVRELKAMNPPIGVLFETEGIFTLEGRSDMQLHFMATTAQEESHNKSEIMNASIEMRFRRGIFLTPKLLGYDLDNEGRLVINEEEAKTVRLIFFMYLYGYTCQNIADQLTLLGRKTKKGNTEWSPGAVLQQLQNERHCGDVLARKTWTPDYLNHKSKKNRQDRNQYRKHDHHEAIISRDDFITVQHMISNAKYGSKGILPELQVITGGALKGFVTIHPKWRFKKTDYLNACQSVYGDDEILILSPEDEVVANEGDFDLRDFEVARTQFFSNPRMMSATFSYSDLKFGITCIRKMSDTEFIELLINPKEHMLAVRAANKNSKTAVRWAKPKEEVLESKSISGAAFIPVLYDMFGWDKNSRYRTLCDLYGCFSVRLEEIRIGFIRGVVVVSDFNYRSGFIDAECYFLFGSIACTVGHLNIHDDKFKQLCVFVTAEVGFLIVLFRTLVRRVKQNKSVFACSIRNAVLVVSVHDNGISESAAGGNKSAKAFGHVLFCYGKGFSGR